MSNYPSRTDIVTAMRNPHVSFKSNEMTGNGKVKILIPALNLINGSYYLNLAVHKRDGFPFDLDYSRTLGHTDLEEIIKKRSFEYYLKDFNCPDSYEPGGEDFFSPCMMEALLMTRIMSDHAFRPWFRHFIPDMDRSSLLIPAIVSDRTDGKLSHLDGLNLSRVWCFSAIQKKLTDDNPLKEQLKTAIRLHLKTAIENIHSGHYEGEHWLGSFAVFAYSEL